MIEECTHIIKHIQAKCGCCIDHPHKMFMLLEISEEHRALHREYDAGIIHHISCKMPEFAIIPVPKLKYRPPTENELEYD